MDYLEHTHPSQLEALAFLIAFLALLVAMCWPQRSWDGRNRRRRDHDRRSP